MTSFSPEDQTIRTICAKHFHQSLWLPATATHPKLKVTFSTTTNFDNIALAAILIIGPMFGTRYMSLLFDKLASDCGVRLICVDRPAFGGSTPVPIDIRMQVWLETVPALLHHLRIKHVALLTHSAGTIYTLNTLLHHRSLLDPEAPFVAFLAPWVPTANSGATLTTLASKLPTSVLNSWSGLNVFINTKIMPSASWSGGIISSTAALFSSSASTDVPGTETSMSTATSTSTSTTAAEQYGFDPETANLIEKLSLKYRFAENSTGANEEVKLCLRKCEDDAWGDASDYSSCISNIAGNEARLEPQASGKLRVEAFFAGEDIMTGKRGQRFFEQCWQSDGVGDKVDFATETFADANHDSLFVDYRKGALKVVFERIARLEQARGKVGVERGLLGR